MANLTEKIWEVAPRKFDDIIDQLLYNRGVIGDAKEEEKKLRFFSPSFDKDIFDPFLMKNLENAVSRIKEAAQKGEKVGIFADYDADGIPGAALFYRALNRIGVRCQVYIPNRESGYGLSKEGIDYLIKEKCALIVTIDLGIRSLNEALYCQKMGVDLIITDHHLPDEKLPEALVINPKQKGDHYPYKELCGCAVAYKVVQGLSKYFPKEIDEKFLKWHLDLVAISTISDVVPLSGENRVLAKYGLIVLRKTQNTGLKELIGISKIKSESIGAYAVGFQIGPRINAPGRIDHATRSFELLVTEDETEAKESARWLNEKNEERQLAMDLAEQEANLIIEKNNLASERIIIIAGDWQRGIIGPTASRLVEKYYRPVVLLSKGEANYTGSARSIAQVNITELLAAVKGTLEKYGGHTGAAGLSLLRTKFEQFQKALKKTAEKLIPESKLKKTIRVDSSVQGGEISKSLYEKIIKFEPFGMGNPKPVLMAQDVVFENMRFVGRGEQHLSAQAVVGNRKFKSIFFSFPYEKEVLKDNRFDIAFNLAVDEWNGESRLSLNIIDIKLSEKDPSCVHSLQ